MKNIFSITIIVISWMFEDQATSHESGGVCSSVFDIPHNKVILDELHKL